METLLRTEAMQVKRRPRRRRAVVAIAVSIAVVVGAVGCSGDDAAEDHTLTTSAPVAVTSEPPASTPATTVLQGSVDQETEGEQPTLVVDSTADTGPGSIRTMLAAARAGDTIGFDPSVFPPESPARIEVTSALPEINAPDVAVDAADAGVILDGRLLPDDQWIAGLQLVSVEGVRVMGLQISHFPGPGIAISGTSTGNTIGGDRGTGAGPFGQGNLLSGNVIGVDLSTVGTTGNTVTGNLIGTDPSDSETIGNDRTGISFGEGAGGNTVGPDNVIAYNGFRGVWGDGTASNVVVGNTLYDNGVGKGKPPSPVLFQYDVAAGVAIGGACSGCTIDLYSRTAAQEDVHEATVTADELGVFSIEQPGGFAGPSLTAVATDAGFYSSEVSFPASGPTRDLSLQRANEFARTQFLSLHSGDLDDTRFSTQFDGMGGDDPESGDETDLLVYRTGVTRARVSMSGMEPELVNWSRPELPFPSVDEIVDRMVGNGIELTYVLMFWDKDTYPGGDGAPCYRFTTDEEIARYVDWVRQIVTHFGDRIQTYEIWNEPDIRDYCPKSIRLDDYVNLITATAPAIREMAPAAQVVAGAVSNTYFEPDYLLDLAASDAMPFVDILSWHPMYGTSPEYDIYTEYYYDYPEFVGEIRETAEANGFTGTYRVDELSWNTPDEARPDQPWVYTPIRANKYFARAAIMHLGLDIDVGLGSSYFVIGNLATLVDAAVPTEIPIVVDSTGEDIVHVSFVLPDGDLLVAFWTDGVAVDEIVSTEASVTFPGLAAGDVVGVDPMASMRQTLVAESENGSLTIRALLVRDYPTFVRLVDPET